MVQIILGIAVILLIAFLVKIKVKVAKNKEPQRRSAFESMLVTMLVKARKESEELAENYRTAEDSKEEGIQKIKDSIKELESEYRKQLRDLLYLSSDIEDNLIPGLKSKPKEYLKKAKEYKDKYSEVSNDSSKKELADTYKKNALMFLDLKERSERRLEKLIKTKDQIKISIDSATAEFESKKYILSDLLSEFQSSISQTISSANYQKSLDIIKSLRKETLDKLRKETAEITAEKKINSSSDIEDGGNDYAKYEDKFNEI